MVNWSSTTGTANKPSVPALKHYSVTCLPHTGCLFLLGRCCQEQFGKYLLYVSRAHQCQQNPTPNVSSKLMTHCDQKHKVKSRPFPHWSSIKAHVMQCHMGKAISAWVWEQARQHNTIALQTVCFEIHKRITERQRFVVTGIDYTCTVIYLLSEWLAVNNAQRGGGWWLNSFENVGIRQPTAIVMIQTKQLEYTVWPEVRGQFWELMKPHR